MTCQWQTGLLVPQPCEMPAMGGCSLCGRSLCMMHTVSGPNGPACPTCANSNQGYEQNEETELESSRSSYYTQYGGANYFTNRDRQSVEREEVEGYDEFET